MMIDDKIRQARYDWVIKSIPRKDWVLTLPKEECEQHSIFLQANGWNMKDVINEDGSWSIFDTKILFK